MEGGVKFLAALIGVAAVSFDCAHHNRAVDVGRNEESSAAATTAWEERHAAVERELASLEYHPWAGRYYWGDGLGANVALTLAPTNGFTYRWKECLGMYKSAQGTVLVDDRGAIRLVWASDNQHSDSFTPPESLFPVRWGQRHYLVPEEEVVAFCNQVNSGFEPRNESRGSVFLQNGDHERPAPGKPELPEEYRAYVLDKPVRAEVIAVGETTTSEEDDGWQEHATILTLNVGRSDGVFPGMELSVCEPPDGSSYGNARVVTVREASCTALIVLTDFDEDKAPTPRVGWKLTTGSLRYTAEPDPAEDSDASSAPSRG